MLGLVMFDNTVIGDRTPEGRAIYKRVKAATGLRFSHFGYCESDETQDQAVKLRSMGYCLRYFSGCFNPYLCRLTNGLTSK